MYGWLFVCIIRFIYPFVSLAVFLAVCELEYVLFLFVFTHTHIYTHAHTYTCSVQNKRLIRGLAGEGRWRRAGVSMNGLEVSPWCVCGVGGWGGLMRSGRAFGLWAPAAWEQMPCWSTWTCEFQRCASRGQLMRMECNFWPLRMYIQFSNSSRFSTISDWFRIWKSIIRCRLHRTNTKVHVYSQTAITNWRCYCMCHDVISIHHMYR